MSGFKGEAVFLEEIAVFEAGAPKAWGPGHVDAFVCANFGLAELGERSAMVLALPAGSGAQGGVWPPFKDL